MKHQDSHLTTIETCTYDKWVNIDLHGEVSIEGDDSVTMIGSISIDIGRDEALKLANEIINHFKDA